MTQADKPLPENTGITEHLVFVALLVPTFIVLAAAAVSLARPDPTVAVQPAATVAACEPCATDNGDEP
jgi:hypothetical protein